MKTFSLGKNERVKRLNTIRTLFSDGKSIVAFPLRAVFRSHEREGNAAQASIMVSVPKRLFKHATDRNFVKRQVREAFRQNKQLLQMPIDRHVDIAFVWLDEKQYDTKLVEKKVRKLLIRMNETKLAGWQPSDKEEKAS